MLASPQVPTPAVVDAPVAHRPWSTVLLGAHLLAVLAGTALLAYSGVLAVATALTARTTAPGERDPFAGLGAFLTVAAGAAALSLAIPLLVMTVDARRGADVGVSGPLSSLAGNAACFGALFVLVSLRAVDQGGLVALPVVGTYTLCAVRLLLLMRAPRRDRPAR